MVSPDSSLCQNGKQVEIITKMIFELCYIEAIIHKGSLARAFWGIVNCLKRVAIYNPPPKNGLVFDAYFERPSFRSLPHVFSQFDGKGCALAHLAVVHINTSVVVHFNDAFGQ